MTEPFQLTVTVEDDTVVGTYKGEANGTEFTKEAEAPFDLDELKREMVSVLVDRLREESIRSVELELLGKILYQALFNGRVEELFHNSRNDFRRSREAPKRLPLQLQLKDELIGYPWEFLRGPLIAPDTEPRYLSASEDFVLSRYAPGGEEWEGKETPRPLKTLLITALPHDILEQLPPDTTYEPLVDTIKGISLIEIVDPILVNPAKQDIEAALDEHELDVVHYIGHGGQVETHRGLVGGIALCEGGEPRSKLIPYSELVVSFQRAARRPRFVFLHLCPGPRTSSGLVARTSFTELAHRLSRVPIQAVLGMQYPLAVDQDLRQGFTETFYKRFAGEGSVATAIQVGRSFVDNNSRADEFGQWNIGKPVLYMSTEFLLTTSGASRSDAGKLAASQVQRNGDQEGRAREPSEPDTADWTPGQSSRPSLFVPPARRPPATRPGGGIP